MAIFTVTAMKLLKKLLECDWNFSFTLWKIQGQREKFHAVKKVTVTEYLLLWNKVVMSEKISRYVTEWTSYINIILLPEHYALTVSRRLQRFHCRHYWMSLRMGYLSANRQLAVKAILPFVYFSVFYCGFGETKENKMTEEKNSQILKHGKIPDTLPNPYTIIMTSVSSLISLVKNMQLQFARMGFRCWIFVKGSPW